MDEQKKKWIETTSVWVGYSVVVIGALALPNSAAAPALRDVRSTESSLRDCKEKPTASQENNPAAT